MGVPIDVWVTVVPNHPAKFKFDGLNGFHRTLNEAALHDQDFLQQRFDAEAKYVAETLRKEIDAKEGDYLEGYANFLHHKLNVDQEDDLVLIETCDDPDLHWEFAAHEIDEDTYRDGIESDTGLLNECSPIDMYSHAYGEGVALEDVYFICPSCGQEPTTLAASKHRFYCGLCGAESMLATNETMDDFIDNMGITAWPFRNGRMN